MRDEKLPPPPLKNLEQMKAEALSVERPTWPYPGGPTDRPDNWQNLRGRDGVVRCLYGGS